MERIADENISNFILMQYDSSTPNIKYVQIKGNIKLPPISYTKKTGLDEKKKVAIIGTSVDEHLIPNEYEVVGYFNTPRSYKLKAESWLISAENIDMNNGNNFIFSSPSSNAKEKLYFYLGVKNIEEISLQKYGTYSLRSNKLIKTTIYLVIIFFVILSTLLIYIWANSDRKLITVSYISGHSYLRIVKTIFKYKLSPFITMSTIVLIFSVLSNTYYLGLWDNVWLYYTFILYAYLFLIVLITHVFTVIKYSLQRGGRRF
ncbi:hypothetical protein [Paenibacillus stellifer]|nr:hypothetical protein [Paenibacillus stellifer]